MKRYNEQSCSEKQIPDNVEKNNELDENKKENEKKKAKENLKQISFHRKNYILKSEIFKENLNSNVIDSEQNYLNPNNTITNYFFNVDKIPQNKLDNFHYIEKITETNKQSSIVKDFANMQQNGIYNTNNPNNKSELTNENLKISNLNFNYASNPAPVISQIYNFATNNIIKINNFYQNENKRNLNEPNINPIYLIKDKFGCIMMKNKVVSDRYYANEILFHQIKNNLKDLCFDSFGNYFIQSYLDIISFDNLNIFLNSINDNFAEICLSPYGTRIIQKIIDKISFIPMLLNKFTFILNNKDFNKICNSQYGNHVVQKFLSAVHSSEYTNFIYNNIYKNFLLFSNNKHGVFIVQKCISEGNEIQRKIIYQLTVDNLFSLIENEFGNYLIQFILLNKKNIEQTFQEILPIILKIEENIISFCFTKYSANVIEKCFEQSENIIRNHILDFLFKYHSNRIVDIMFNNYGIYIILKAIKSQNGKYKNKLIDIINKSDKELKCIINSNSNNYKNILKIMHKYIEFDYIYKVIINKIINIINGE